MHDGLAQTLSYLGHQVDGLTEVAASERVRSGATPESPGAPACEYADTIVAASSRMRGIIDDATAEVRRFIAGLHVQPRPPRALQAVLEDALATTESDGLVSARFETDLTLPLRLRSRERTDHAHRQGGPPQRRGPRWRNAGDRHAPGHRDPRDHHHFDDVAVASIRRSRSATDGATLG